MLECVPNVSEGRVDTAIDAIARATGAPLLDVHRDADHNRSVFTIGGGTHTTLTATRRLAAATAAALDLSNHDGVHPRLGALDVVPFVALDVTAGARAAAAARAFATWWSSVYGVPCFFYDDADPYGRDLPSLRREAFVERAPDIGPSKPHPRLGATAVGARQPLVALNCVLDGGEVDDARAIARAVRERGGGLPGVRALGFWLASRGLPQVSMNLVDLEGTGIDDACARVGALAAERGREVREIELVGLLPAAELERCGPAVRATAGLDVTRTIESRLSRI
ncbi:MAG: glutamate formiminotransferase [Acidimicrobiia bacterium]|nr:glutamate formiminotransferase [Acidimicrobiia bacterium]